MSASLVGSEMCIRDRAIPVLGPVVNQAADPRRNSRAGVVLLNREAAEDDQPGDSRMLRPQLRKARGVQVHPSRHAHAPACQR
eukprot:8214226-Alexandrium_andersonii.AAC.1